MSTVIFVHGLWLHTTSWGQWVEHFNADGYAAHAPGWPGSSPTVAEARANPDRAGGFGVNDVTRHYADFVRRLDRPVVAVGHSTGGLIVQRLLIAEHVAAAIAIAPVSGASIRFAPASEGAAPDAAVSRTRCSLRGTITLTFDEFGLVFGGAVSKEECAELYERWSVPSPGRPLMENAMSDVLTGSPTIDVRTHRGPLLLITGDKDRTASPSPASTAPAQHARTDIVELHDRGHSLTIDHGWTRVADTTLSWMKERGF